MHGPHGGAYASHGCGPLRPFAISLSTAQGSGSELCLLAAETAAPLRGRDGSGFFVVVSAMLLLLVLYWDERMVRTHLLSWSGCGDMESEPRYYLRIYGVGHGSCPLPASPGPELMSTVSFMTSVLHYSIVMTIDGALYSSS